MYRKSNRFAFSGCQNNAAENPKMCSCGGYEFTNANTSSAQYARLFVESQSYKNCANPQYALKNGTFFNDLYMPLDICPDCCTSVMDGACAKNKNIVNRTKCCGKEAYKNG